MEEIKEALFDIEDEKPLGIDGYTSVFSKKAWEVVKGDIYDAVSEKF